MDLAICTDDGFTYWHDAAYAIDMGIPAIVVNHAVSEEAGLMNLARHLAKVHGIRIQVMEVQQQRTPAARDDRCHPFGL